MDDCPQNSHIKPKRVPKAAKTKRQQNFVHNLRWAIERLGLTLKALADNAGVDEMWVRRVATRGVKWTKPSGTEAIKKLEAYLGCPRGTLWDEDGHRFRSGIAAKHLSGCDPVTNLQRVIGHFEGNQPPLLARAIEIIDYLGRSIDNPNVEPPKEEDQQLSEESSGEMVTWDQSNGWHFSERGIDCMLGFLQGHIDSMTRVGVPGVSEIHVGREEIERSIKDEDLVFLGYFAWLDLYAAKHGMGGDEVQRLVQQKEEEYQTKLKDDAAQAVKVAELSQSADAPEHEKAGPLALTMKRRRDAPIAEPISASVQAARQTAREHAPLLIDSLPADEQQFFCGPLESRSYVLKIIERQLFEKLIGEEEQTPMTIQQAIQSVTSTIAGDYRAWVARQIKISRPEDDSPGDHEFDDEQEEESE
jgi:hypothetical protein